MLEFTINSSINKTTGYAPFKWNGGYMPHMITELPRENNISPGVREFAEKAIQNLMDAHDAIIESRVYQTHEANKKRGEEPDIKINDLVYLSTKNLNLPKGRTSKLLPKYLGPYPITEALPNTSTYQIGLPTELAKQGIHNKFHVNLLRKCIPNDDVLFPERTKSLPYNFGEPSERKSVKTDTKIHRTIPDNRSQP